MLSPPGTHFTAESTEAMRIKSLAEGENILMLGIEPSTFESKVDILNTTPIVQLPIVIEAGALWRCLVILEVTSMNFVLLSLCLSIFAVSKVVKSPMHDCTE